MKKGLWQESQEGSIWERHTGPCSCLMDGSQGIASQDDWASDDKVRPSVEEAWANINSEKVFKGN